jgi:hypothetical protein
MSILLLILLAIAPAQASDQFSATVSKSEAVFVMPFEERDKWFWRRADTRPNQQEYRMDVTLKNQDKEYTFGFYLWKRADARPGSGSFKDLIAAGQKSLFERSASGLMTIVRDADVKVKVKDNHLEISLKDSADLQRLFSGHPTEAIFKIKYPDAPEVSQKVTIVYL